MNRRILLVDDDPALSEMLTEYLAGEGIKTTAAFNGPDGAAAALSVLAHMEDLAARGVVATEGPPSIVGTYRLADALPGG